MSQESNHSEFRGTAKDVCSGLDVVPTVCDLLPLKTKEECEARDETIDVYIAQIPVKSASRLLDLLRTGISGFHNVNVQHLRRFASGNHVPAYLNTSTGASHPSMAVGFQNDVILEVSEHDLDDKVSNAQLRDDLCHLFKQSDWSSHSSANPEIKIIPVPIHAPTSQEQADQWSLQYWPAIYKKCNPFGPHPSIVKHAETEILPNLGAWAGLANLVAKESAGKGLGEMIGCVIVERASQAEEKVVVAAGDARWHGKNEAEWKEDNRGNVMGHAVMRAIAMVAKKRIRHASTVAVLQDATSQENLVTGSSSSVQSPDMESERSQHFLDYPLSEIEQRIYQSDTLLPNGYLCLDLEIYITHEPCVMCSMAILHSRFGRCVFKRRMHLTGGLTAERGSGITFPKSSGDTDQTGLGYGLFWRPELNWKLLAWEQAQEQEFDRVQDCVDGKVHV